MYKTSKNKTTDTIIIAAMMVGALMLIGTLAYGGWHLKRWFNYEFEYKEQIQKNIKEMVKESCLK